MAYYDICIYNAKHFDNHAVVFLSVMYKTEGDSPYKDYNGANSDSRCGDMWLLINKNMHNLKWNLK